jgi:RNA polymerase sigma-70 factor (ECF subfamily)
MVIARTHLGTTAALDDATCIRASLRRPEAFRTVFQRHHERLRRYVVSRVGPQAADDIVAESFIVAFQARDRFVPSSGTDALPWLLGVATNVLARHRAAERRWVAQCSAEHFSHDRPAPFEDRSNERTDAARAAHALARALRRLPSREREPLLLHVLGELSYEEIASTLGIPVGTVASRINRGRARLSAWMEKAR